MKQLLRAILSELDERRPAMLATIIGRSGSAPRGAGTAMAVLQNGDMIGTVGGGMVEYRAKLDALALMQKHACDVREYEIRADEKGVRSGSVRILFRSFDGETGRALVRQILGCIESGEEAFLVCQLAGAKDGSFVTGGGEVCAKTGLYRAPGAPVIAGEEENYFIEPLLDEPRVLLFGGGHVAQVMARQLDLIGCRVWMIEDREEFARAELFPTAERVLQSEYPESEARLKVTGRDHAIVMSRGHEQDFQILRWVLRSAADYIGCIGSKKKIALTKDWLLADGLTREQIARLHAPIGLAIGAETPAEIAVSVAAELIAYRAGRSTPHGG